MRDPHSITDIIAEKLLLAIVVMLIAVFLLSAMSEGQQLPDKPQPKVVDKKFILVSSIGFAAAAADIHSTRYCITTNPRCYEAVGIFSGGRPSTGQLVAINIPMQAGVTGLGYLLKKKGKRWWWVPQVAFAGLRVGVAVHNYKQAGRK